ncbi:MAG: hypothetical protein IT539_15465 [Bradyrhizobiaceae bacterium]|nr:hypothetical protein [Bradyrhizobiaceae bacterium]
MGLASIIKDNASPDRREILVELVERVILGREQISLTIKRAALLAKILGTPAPASAEHNDKQAIQIEASLQIVRRGSETRLILRGQDHQKREPDQSLIKAIARGSVWFESLISREAGSIAEIAKYEGVTEAYIRRLLEFALLAPPLIEDELTGRNSPIGTTDTFKLRRTILELWSDQRR